MPASTRRRRALPTLAAGLVCTGCASFINEPVHPLRVETAREDGVLVEGAQCTLTNDRDTLSLRSGETTLVPRSRGDLQVQCLRPGYPPATGRLISRANAGLAGNLFFGGGIGALIDHSNATAYTYPTWIRLVFGRSLVMDRREEVDGQPLRGRAADGETPP